MMARIEKFTTIEGRAGFDVVGTRFARAFKTWEEAQEYIDSALPEIERMHGVVSAPCVDCGEMGRTDGHRTKSLCGRCRAARHVRAQREIEGECALKKKKKPKWDLWKSRLVTGNPELPGLGRAARGRDPKCVQALKRLESVIRVGLNLEISCDVAATGTTYVTIRHPDPGVDEWVIRVSDHECAARRSDFTDHYTVPDEELRRGATKADCLDALPKWAGGSAS